MTATQAPYQFSANPAIQYPNQLGPDSSLQFPDSSSYDDDLYSTALNGAQTQPYGSTNLAIPASASNQLVRRNTRQEVATRNAGIVQEQWNNHDSTGQEREWEDMNDAELDQKAALAKKDAQAKRKQIPPFVLKLWRYVECL